MSRLMEKYQQQVAPQLMERFKNKNKLSVPRIQKIVVNMGVGKAVDNKKLIEEATKHLAMITCQKPLITKAKKAIAGFKLRENQAIGCKVTLRGKRMFEFLDRLISIVIPRIRDFRGLSPNAFDGRGNYTLGLTEQIVFPEIEYDKIDKLRGLEVSIITPARNDDESRKLLQRLGMPFRKEGLS